MDTLTAVTELLSRNTALAERILALAERRESAATLKLNITPRERRVLDALGDDTLTGEDLAQRMKLEYVGSFRELLAIMSAHGVLSSTSDGYFRGPNV